MYHGDDDAPIRTEEDRALVATLAARLSPRPAGEARLRRLERIRDAVASSDYENPLKLSIALDRLLARLCSAGSSTVGSKA